MEACATHAGVQSPTRMLMNTGLLARMQTASVRPTAPAAILRPCRSRLFFGITIGRKPRRRAASSRLDHWYFAKLRPSDLRGKQSWRKDRIRLKRAKRGLG